MSNHPAGHPPMPSSSALADDSDILNDSISINLDDDSFDGPNSTLVLSHLNPEQPRAGSSSSAQSTVPHSSQSSQAIPSGPYQATPARNEDECTQGPSSESGQSRRPRTNGRDRWAREQLRNEELEHERDWLREMNGMLERAADEMEKIKDKFENVQAATETSHQLLDLYSKILAQTEHTRDLLSNPSWQGLTADIQRRAEAKKQEEIRQAKLREKEREEQLLREQQQQQQQAEEEALRLRQSQQPKPAARGGTGRGRASTAGRMLRGKSRIGRIVR